MTNSPDLTNRNFVVQQNGLIRVFQNDSNVNTSSTFLNVSNKISTGSERGLLGLAFHPNYASNGYFYIDYTQVTTGNTIIARYRVSTTDPNKADSLSEQVLLNIYQPYSNHNGGNLLFGLDGYLYINMGDGGSAGDPGNRAQNLDSLLGKILRVDVDNPSGGNNYGIPPTNPFAGGGGRKEIFTWGMRNPWRMTQDPVTGILWCGDVGQNLYEEVDIIENGKNYGWRIMEGLHCYNPSTGCNQTGLTLPVKEYAHGSSHCSVTGGYVYRGSRRPDLTGRYIYGDYCSGYIWKLKYEGGIVTEDALLTTTPSSLLSFGKDLNNELYMCCGSAIYRFNKNNVSEINNENNSPPAKFSLSQNYPNPFNPETMIQYQLPELSKVRLSVYNSAGKEVRRLVNTTQMSGNYSIVWNGKDDYGVNLASGIYFYSINTGKFSETKKMVLIK
jgi:hypothetical protein